MNADASAPAARPASAGSSSPSVPIDETRTRHDLPWSELADALMRNHGSLAPAAKGLGISVRTLQRCMRELGMKYRDFRG
jgi:transcriptional regulator with GAF, ATPase, and Fis domain